MLNAPGMLGGLKVLIVDAQKQARTPRDVRGPWVRPKVPNKAQGRKGTRRQFKHRNAPHFIMLYREPEDAIRFNDTVILTPRQADELRRLTIERAWDVRPGAAW